MQNTTTQIPPQNALEQTMAEAQAGKIPEDTFLRLLLKTPILIPSKQEVQADGAGLAPIVLTRGGTDYVAVYTSPPRLQNIAGQVPYCLEMVASAMLPRLPQGCGLVINVGYTLGLEIAPYGVESIIRDLIGPEVDES